MMIYCQRVLFVAIRCPTLQVLNSDPPSVLARLLITVLIPTVPLNALLGTS